MFHRMKLKYAIFLNIKVTKIERSTFIGRPGVGNPLAQKLPLMHVKPYYQNQGRRHGVWLGWRNALFFPS